MPQNVELSTGKAIYYANGRVVDRADVPPGQHPVSNNYESVENVDGEPGSVADDEYKGLANEEIDLFLIAGQSNAVGQGTATDSPTPPTGAGFEIQTNGPSERLSDPVGDGRDGAAVASDGSAWPAFCDEYYTQTGRTSGYIQEAVGGTAQVPAAADSGGHWMSSGTHWTRSVEDLNAAISYLQDQLCSVTFQGILWSQGEQDAFQINDGVITKSEYQSHLSTMIDYYRAELGSSMSFWIFRTGQQETKDTTGHQAVRDAQEAVATNKAGVEVVFRDAVNFPSEGKMQDKSHYTQAGYNEMGRTGAQNVSQTLSG